jgi:hypothetical protein
MVRVAVARDEATAERWRAALAARDIEAQLRIEDGSYLAPMGSTFSPQTFVYPLLVDASDREAAIEALVDLGRRGPFAPRRSSAPLDWRGAVAVVLVLLLLAVALAARAG